MRTVLLAKNYECLMIFDHLPRYARQTQPREKLVEIPGWNTNDPKENRASRDWLVAEIGVPDPRNGS
jgi:hypothetical protein